MPNESGYRLALNRGVGLKPDRGSACAGSSIIRIQLNERDVEVDAGATLFGLRNREMPGADVLILNGHPASGDLALSEGDLVVLIERGRRPSDEELESLLLARHTPGVHEAIRRATVGVAGLGGLGSAVATALARTGVGRLVLVDFDIIEPSNLNRQQYFLDQLGQSKVEAMSENVRRMTPLVEVIGRREKVNAENAREIFSGCDIVTECFDKSKEKAMLVNALTGTVPVVAASGLAGYGPANEIRTDSPIEGLVIVGDAVSEARPGRGLMAPRVGVAAHHQANAVLRLILGCDPCRG